MILKSKAKSCKIFTWVVEMSKINTIKIAIATFAGLPNPPVKGGAVETLIDDLCKLNETENRMSIDVYSVYDDVAEHAAHIYKNTEHIFYQKRLSRRLSIKNIVCKLFGRHIPDNTMCEIVRQINRRRYDYVIITSINYEMEYVFRRIQSKVIWYLHGDPLSVLSLDAIKRITEQCSAVITVSDFVNKRVASVKPKCNVITVRNCTDLLPVPLEEEPIVRQKIRDKIGVKSEDFLFTYIGRITPIKGIYELIQAFVVAGIPNSKLLIVGEPSDDEEKCYFEEIKRIATVDVKYLGYVAHDTLNEVYCASDCIVAPSVCQEAALLIALEASICGRPLIATNIGGIPEYAEENTLLVEYNQKFIDNIAAAMKKIRNFSYNEQKNAHKINYVSKYYDDFYKVLCTLTEE